MYFCSKCKQMFRGETKHHVALSETGDDVSQTLTFGLCNECFSTMFEELSNQERPKQELDIPDITHEEEEN